MEKVISRKEKRKAKRNEKKQHKHQALIDHQKLLKLKQNSRSLRKGTIGSRDSGMNEREIPLSESDNDEDEWQRDGVSGNGCHFGNGRDIDSEGDELSLRESDSDEDSPLPEPTILRKKSEKKKQKGERKKSKFEEFLEMERNKGASAEEDLEMERRLAKKLKVKNGKLKDAGDELNFLFDGISSIFDSLEQEDDSEIDTENFESFDDKKNKKKRKKRKQLEHDSDSDHVFDNTDTGEEDIDITSEKHSEEENADIIENKRNKKSKRKRRKSQGVSDTNIVVSDEGQAKHMSCVPGEEGEANTSIAKDDTVVNGTQASCKYVAPHLRSKSGDKLQEYAHIRRRIRGLLNRLSESNVESSTGEISSIFQSVSRAVAFEIIIEEVLSSCSQGPRGNEQYAAVFAALVAGLACLVGIDFGAGLMASFAKSFEDEYMKEDNLSLRNLSLLLSYLCMFGVCSSDLIYDFLLNLSRQLTEIDVSTILTVLQCCGTKLRAEDPASMKDFILSVQNKVSELKAAAADVEAKALGKRMEFMLETICEIKNNKKRVKEDSAPHTRIKKWLQKLRVEDVTIRGVKWSKLLDPNKKSQWWFSGDFSSASEAVDNVAFKIDKEINEAQKMLQLASKLRMNTDTRRAIFCVIMSGEDYLDAFEKILGLRLQGKQDREIMRVLVECCLQEKVFNKYYTALASKLCSHDKNQKFTLQYCLWDQFKELESMPLMRSMHLAKFVAEMIASFTLSLAVLKVVDLVDPTQLSAKRIMHFRMMFEAILEHPENVVWNAFTRIAVAPELEELRNGMEYFIREFVMTASKAGGNKYKVAKKAMSNVEGALM